MTFHILTEAGDAITTEDGDYLVTEDAAASVVEYTYFARRRTRK